MVADPGFTTIEMARVFSAGTRVSAFLRFESALASARAEMGLIPPDVAAEIADACREGPDDPVETLRLGWEAGSPVVALLEWLRPRLSDSAVRVLHVGATTQDVLDTATALQMRAGLELIGQGLAGVSRTLAELADEHRRTPAWGRTLLQDAVPTTFGTRAALWLAPLNAHRRGIARLAPGLPVQLGGPVGDGASFDGHGPELAERLAALLGLTAPLSSWHTDRTPVTEALALVGRVAASMAKIGVDVALLSQPAIGEVRARAGRSSSMKDKANPIDAVRAVAAARVCHAAVTAVTGAPPHELERAAGTWQSEWELVPIGYQAAGAAVEAIGRCLTTLEVNGERMSTNLGDDDVPEGVVVDRVLEDFRELEGG